MGVGEIYPKVNDEEILAGRAVSVLWDQASAAAGFPLLMAAA
jgi:hypothetical protein